MECQIFAGFTHQSGTDKIIEQMEEIDQSA